MKKVILNRAKRTNIVSMVNNTHSLEQVEALMWKESDILKDPNVGKERKKEALKKLKLLERHHRDCSDKHINGKKYPVKEKPVEISKKDLIVLIESVPSLEKPKGPSYDYIKQGIEQDLDLSGGSPEKGKNRFYFQEKGWDKPKFEHRKCV